MSEESHDSSQFTKLNLVDRLREKGLENHYVLDPKSTRFGDRLAEYLQMRFDNVVIQEPKPKKEIPEPYATPISQFSADVTTDDLQIAQMVGRFLNGIQPEMVRILPQVNRGEQTNTSFEFYKDIPECEGESSDVFVMLFNTAESFKDLEEDKVKEVLKTKLQLYQEFKKDLVKAAYEKRLNDDNSLAISQQFTEDGLNSVIYIDTHLDTLTTIRLADKAASLVFIDFIKTVGEISPKDMRQLYTYLRQDMPELVLNSIYEDAKAGKATSEMAINMAQVKTNGAISLLELTFTDKGRGFPQEVVDAINGQSTKPIISEKTSEIGEERGIGLKKVARDVRELLHGTMQIGNTEEGSMVRIMVPLETLTNTKE